MAMRAPGATFIAVALTDPCSAVGPGQLTALVAVPEPDLSAWLYCQLIVIWPDGQVGGATGGSHWTCCGRGGTKPAMCPPLGKCQASPRSVWAPDVKLLKSTTWSALEPVKVNSTCLRRFQAA